MRSFEVELGKSRGGKLSWRRLHVNGRVRARLPGGGPFAIVRVIARAEGEELRYASAVLAT